MNSHELKAQKLRLFCLHRMNQILFRFFPRLQGIKQGEEQHNIALQYSACIVCD